MRFCGNAGVPGHHSTVRGSLNISVMLSYPPVVVSTSAGSQRGLENLQSIHFAEQVYTCSATAYAIAEGHPFNEPEL